MKMKAQHSKNLRYSAQAVLRWMFIEINTHIKKKQRPLKNNPTLHLKGLEKEQTK